MLRYIPSFSFLLLLFFCLGFFFFLVTSYWYGALETTRTHTTTTKKKKEEATTSSIKENHLTSWERTTSLLRDVYLFLVLFAAFLRFCVSPLLLYIHFVWTSEGAGVCVVVVVPIYCVLRNSRLTVTWLFLSNRDFLLQ